VPGAVKIKKRFRCDAVINSQTTSIDTKNMEQRSGKFVCIECHREKSDGRVSRETPRNSRAGGADQRLDPEETLCRP